VTVSKKIKRAMRMRIPEIGKKKANVIVISCSL